MSYDNRVGITMKNMIICSAVLVLAVCCGAGYQNPAEEVEVDWRARRMRIGELGLRLDTVGVLGLASDPQTPDTAPLIHSRYWVDRLPRTEIDRRACELEIRDFGLAIVRQLEEMVLSRKISRDIDELENTAEGLLRLSEWLSTAHGYGNYRLKRWTELIALNVIARLAVHEQCDLARVKELLSRVADTKRNLTFRVDVLNDEAPHRFSLPLFANSDGNAALQRQWGTRLRATNEHYRELVKKGLINAVPYDFASVAGDDPEYSFYRDDNVGDATLVEAWDKKSHYVFCVGDFDRDCKEDVEKIVLFREAAGSLPLPNASELQGREEGRRYCERMDRLWFEAVGNRDNIAVGDIVLRVVSGQPLDLRSQTLMNRRK